MNCALRICASNASSGSQKLSMLASRIGLAWRPSCCQVSILHELFQRADAAGQRHEGVRALEHQPLALVHVGRDDHLLHPGQRILARAQKIRDDAGDGAAMIEHGFGDRAHQADRAAAIDQANIVFSEDPAEPLCGLDEAGVCAGAGAAIDTNSLDSVHIGHVALQRRCVKASGFARIKRIAPQIAGNRERIVPGKAVLGGQSLYMTDTMQRRTTHDGSGQALTMAELTTRRPTRRRAEPPTRPRPKRRPCSGRWCICGPTSGRATALT